MWVWCFFMILVILVCCLGVSMWVVLMLVWLRCLEVVLCWVFIWVCIDLMVVVLILVVV